MQNILLGIIKESKMNAEQRRIDLIDTLYADSDPGTFTDLELLTLAELKSLFDIMFGDDVA